MSAILHNDILYKQILWIQQRWRYPAADLSGE